MAAHRPGWRAAGPIADPAADVRALDGLDKDAIVERFRGLYGQDPPCRMRREVLVRAVAHRMQQNAAGGPDTALARRLARLAMELRRTGSIPAEAPSPTIKAGTRLLRTWNGETHAVTIVAGGYLYQGTTHRSLSAIARLITGTRWSGPAFFGLGRGASRGSRRADGIGNEPPRDGTTGRTGPACDPLAIAEPRP